MSAMTPHIRVENDADGVKLTLRHVSIVLPQKMALDLAKLLMDAAKKHDPLTARPLPTIRPQGDPFV